MNRTKITDHKTLIKLLRHNGFVLERTGPHDKWTKGNKSIHVPNKHGKFSRMLAERLAKEAAII
jgi:predicted RNA binding protein YcfA (HicA-like mRNA interferase family)